MRIKARFFTRIRELTDKREDEVETGEGFTLRELLRLLEERYGEEFRSYIKERAGTQGGIQFLINGRNASFLKGLGTVLKEGDVVALLPPSSGG